MRTPTDKTPRRLAAAIFTFAVMVSLFGSATSAFGASNGKGIQPNLTVASVTLPQPLGLNVSAFSLTPQLASVVLHATASAPNSTSPTYGLTDWTTNPTTSTGTFDHTYSMSDCSFFVANGGMAINVADGPNPLSTLNWASSAIIVASNCSAAPLSLTATIGNATFDSNNWNLGFTLAMSASGGSGGYSYQVGGSIGSALLVPPIFSPDGTQWTALIYCGNLDGTRSIIYEVTDSSGQTVTISFALQVDCANLTTGGNPSPSPSPTTNPCPISSATTGGHPDLHSCPHPNGNSIPYASPHPNGNASGCTDPTQPCKRGSKASPSPTLAPTVSASP